MTTTNLPACDWNDLGRGGQGIHWSPHDRGGMRLTGKATAPEGSAAAMLRSERSAQPVYNLASLAEKTRKTMPAAVSTARAIPSQNSLLSLFICSTVRATLR